ncbi:TIM barrel protein [Planctomicrobium sp. SH527]|uniref:TIM barrel protein n=1 Tax=Planctomicrobium sp. SH527 TaxID=3448123 RepID=UPI003F5B932F
MIKSAVTISLVSEAKGGPFVFWSDLPESIQCAAELGFNAVELFLPGPNAVAIPELKQMLSENRIGVAAVGTGAGMVLHKLSLTDASADIRHRAEEFISEMICFAGALKAPAIIGSMQGRWTEQLGRETTLDLFGESLRRLGMQAAEFGVPLIYEPLNRYETNLCNTLAEGVQLIESRNLENVVLLADLFHMNIEEIDLAESLRNAGRHVGHLHFVDSNRRAAGFGHIDLEAVASALNSIGYQGYASAEALPWPDSKTAARQTIDAWSNCFRRDVL